MAGWGSSGNPALKSLELRMCYTPRPRPDSSAGEHHIDNVGVVGSIPTQGIQFMCEHSLEYSKDAAGRIVAQCLKCPDSFYLEGSLENGGRNLRLTPRGDDVDNVTENR